MNPIYEFALWILSLVELYPYAALVIVFLLFLSSMLSTGSYPDNSIKTSYKR